MEFKIGNNNIQVIYTDIEYGDLSSINFKRNIIYIDSNISKERQLKLIFTELINYLLVTFHLYEDENQAIITNGLYEYFRSNSMNELGDILIQNVIYKLEYTFPQNIPDCRGVINFKKNKIFINSELCRDTVQTIILHESLHGLFFELGLELENEEDYILSWESPLSMLISDNKDFFDLLYRRNKIQINQVNTNDLKEILFNH